jgi:hypothetical protein
MWYIYGKDMYKVLSWGKLNLKEHFEDIGTDRVIILKWTLKTWDVRVTTGFIWLSQGTRGRKLRITRNAGNLTK